MKVSSSQGRRQKEVGVPSCSLDTMPALCLAFLSQPAPLREGRARRASRSPESMGARPLNSSSLLLPIKCFLEDTPIFVGSSGENAPGLKSRDKPAGSSSFTVARTPVSGTAAGEASPPAALHPGRGLLLGTVPAPNLERDAASSARGFNADLFSDKRSPNRPGPLVGV